MINRLLYLCFTLCISQSIIAQLTLKGQVTNEAGELLEGAVVYLEDSDYATLTDSKGNYIIENIEANDYILVASYLGYENHKELVSIDANLTIDIEVGGKLYNINTIEIVSDRANAQAPFTYTDQSAQDLQKRNIGQDIPFLLNHTPSTVVTSDAGTGIGYTGLRLRGSDQTRINVTINGVPLNDAESHNVFWVDLPDLASSINQVQLQRGVGPSTNGPGAFGGTISISTNDVAVKPFVELDGTLGSFNTRKLGVKLGTGLLNNKYSIEGRYSLVKSDGYVDRATADLSSYYIAINRVTSKSSLKFLTFSGQERTYQAWYGVPEAKVKGDDSALLNHYYNNLGSIYKSPADSVNLFSSDRRYNYYTYDHQVDNYKQEHYQLHLARHINDNTSVNGALFYTLGKGYFEEYRYDDDLDFYNLPTTIIAGDTLTSSNLVRRRWLDNDYYGGLINLRYQPLDQLQITTGGLISRYVGDHFGQVTFTEDAIPFTIGDTYYDNKGKKLDGSAFVRSEYTINDKWHTYLDLQYRGLTYTANGDDNDDVNIDIDTKFSFFNPKAGISYDLKGGLLYLSYARANKEPNRSDFIDNQFGQEVKSEQLDNYELGYRWSKDINSLGVNAYFMNYTNQLIPTGDLNDVGSPLRTNVAESYRMGIEVNGVVGIHRMCVWDGDITLSQNKIANFGEVIFDYTNGFDRQVINHTDTDIAFSPNIIARSQFTFLPIKSLAIFLESKYVGQQYLDNTQNSDRALDPYLVNNARITYNYKPNKFVNNVEASLHLFNLLNTQYAANGYTYSYIFGDTITENFLYPQAGFHIMGGLRFRW